MPPVTGLQYYNDQMLVLQEHYDDFIMERQLSNPNIWGDRIPRGSYKLFQGMEPKMNVYRGSLPKQAGLSDWTQVGVSRKPALGDTGFDNCAVPTPQRYTYAWETLTYRGYQDSFQSDPVCLEDLKWVDYAREQLSMIVRSGVDFGVSIYENFSREVYVWQAAMAGRTAVFCEGALQFEDSAAVRFSYDPFLTTTDIDSATVPYITFPAGLEVSTLNWTFLDYLRNSLSQRASAAAIAKDSGMSVFGLMLDLMDFERMVRSDVALLEDFRWARTSNLIQGYDFGLKTYRGFALMQDDRQMRFRFKTITGGNVVATRVMPLRAGRAVTIGNVPEPNPDYYRAELGLGVIFMNDVVVNLFVPQINDLGSGMVFGPAPGHTGEWKWINIPDPATNMLGNTGFFYGRFQIFPKPLLYSSECTVFVYRRCPQSWKTVCGIQSLDTTYSGTAAVALAAAAADGDVDTTNSIVTVTLSKTLDVGFGDWVTVVHGGGTRTMKVVDSTLAPTYTLEWSLGTGTAPTAYTEFTTASTVTIV
jgi:hypothetical protein